MAPVVESLSSLAPVAHAGEPLWVVVAVDLCLVLAIWTCHRLVELHCGLVMHHRRLLQACWDVTLKCPAIHPSEENPSFELATFGFGEQDNARRDTSTRPARSTVGGAFGP